MYNIVQLAHPSDPLTLKLCGDDLHKHRLFHLSKIEPAFIDGQVFVIRLRTEDAARFGAGPAEAERIECVATVAQPGNSTWDTEEKRKFLQDALDAVSPESKQWLEEEVNPSVAEGKTHIPNGAKASYYLQAIATSSSAQRKGLASAILHHLEDLAQKDQTVVALNTISDSAVRLYERCGFQTVHKAQVVYGDGLGEGVSYVMVNDPSTRAP
ncbi:hypothetical protein IAT40_007816 [Kwoniella sp. CBS 6097]